MSGKLDGKGHSACSSLARQIFQYPGHLSVQQPPLGNPKLLIEKALEQSVGKAVSRQAYLPHHQFLAFADQAVPVGQLA